MGTKRIGLARVEALMENLKRDLALGGSTISGNQRKCVTLTDAAAAEAIRSALTVAESGTIFVVPALTGDTQTLDLPAHNAAMVGTTYTFTMAATAGQILTISTPGAEKIVGCVPKGDGDNNAASAANDSVSFAATAIIGTHFSLTCVSATAGVAWLLHDVVEGVAANTGTVVLA